MTREEKMNWQDELAAAETVEDFASIKDILHLYLRKKKSILANINSPDILRTFLREYLDSLPDLFRRFTKEKFIRFFYVVAEKKRIDLLDVFFAEKYLVYSDLIETVPRRRKFCRLMIDTARKGIVDMLLFFLEKGMDVNACFENSYFTPLSMACLQDNIDVVILLLNHDADPNVGIGHVTDPVKCAISSEDVRILDHLIIHGADLHHRNDLWSWQSWSTYTGKRDANFQRLADHNVLPSRDLYLKIVSLLETNPRLEGIVAILREAMKRNGHEIE